MNNLAVELEKFPEIKNDVRKVFFNFERWFNSDTYKFCRGIWLYVWFTFYLVKWYYEWDRTLCSRFPNFKFYGGSVVDFKEEVIDWLEITTIWSID